MTTRTTFGARAQSFCALVGARVPIIQAPMAGGWTTPRLVATAANAGALGTLAAGRLSKEQLAAALEAIRDLTNGPFGVNFILAPPEPFDGNAERVQSALAPIRTELGLPSTDAATPVPPPVSLDEQVDLVLARGVRIVSFALGSPAPFVERIKARGGIVIATATTVSEAAELEAAGVDAVVAQGAEAGGHRSTFHVRHGEEVPLVGTLVLVPSIADAIRLPVIASGGIMDGRGLAAALTLGASAVQMGTRFLLTEESGAFPDYRRRLAEAAETDTVITWQYTGRPARSIRTRFVDHLDAEEVTPLPWPYQSMAAGDIYQAAVARDSGDFFPLLAGQGTSLRRGSRRAAEVVNEVAAEGQRILRELAGA